MQIDWAVVFATLAGPILAVWASEWRQRRRAVHERKEWVFRTLMTTRGAKMQPLHVEALNPSQPPPFWLVALSAVTGKQGGFGKLFLFVAALRFAGKVTLGLGRGFTSAAKLILTLHSSGTGRMRSLYGLWFFELPGSGHVSWRPAPQFER